MQFSFDFEWSSIRFDILLETKFGRFYLAEKICYLLSMITFVCRWSLGTKQLIKTNENTDRKLSTLALTCGLIATSACGFCGSSLVSLDAKSPQHKSRKLIVQKTATSLSTAFINLKVFIAFLRSALLLATFYDELKLDP